MSKRKDDGRTIQLTPKAMLYQIVESSAKDRGKLPPKSLDLLNYLAREVEKDPSFLDDDNTIMFLRNSWRVMFSYRTIVID